MEHEQRKTGSRGGEQSLDAQSTATSAGDGAQPKPSREKTRQFQQGSTSEEQGGRPESVPAIEFSFEGRPVRSVVKDGQTWFVAVDVCAVLEHSDASKAVSRLDDDEKGATNVRTPGGVQEMNVVNESGLYNLIFTSRKPQAKVFRRWVTDEVLPSIRKTGGYRSAQGRTGAVQVMLPQPGRYVVTVLPDGNLHLHQTAYEALLGDLELGILPDARLRIEDDRGVLERDAADALHRARSRERACFPAPRKGDPRERKPGVPLPEVLDPFPDQIAEPASALAPVRVSIRKVTTDASACEWRC